MIEKAHREKETPSAVPSFYMASYLLDVVCAMNLFSGLNLSWHSSKAPIHVYCQIFWETKYN
jgi:hypothetical protein